MQWAFEPPRRRLYHVPAGGLFLSPFWCGAAITGWRWSWRFLRDHPEQVLAVASDTWDGLAKAGLVIA